MARRRRRSLAPPRLAQPPTTQPVQTVVTAKPVLSTGRRPTRFDSAVAWGINAQLQGQDINSTFTQIREANVRDEDLGFVLREVANRYGTTIGLNPNLQSWYDSQLAAMQQSLVTAKERVAKEIAKLKASGKDYERSDIVRIYLRFYPKWSDQYARKAKELPRKLAKEAKSTAYKAHQAALKEKVEVALFTVQTDKGPKTFEAVDAEQAERKAELYGLEVKSVSQSGTKTLTGIEAADRVKTGQARGVLDLAESMLTYGEALGYDIPRDSVPIRDGKSFKFLSKDDAESLSNLPAYQKTEGDVSEKLAAALTALTSALEKVGPYLISFVTDLHIKVGAQENITLIKATSEEIEKIEKACPGGYCPSEILTLNTYKIVGSGGIIVYVEALDERTAKQKAIDAGYAVGWITKANPEDLKFQEVIDIPKLVEDKGASNATELLQDAGVTDATELIDTFQEIQETQTEVIGKLKDYKIEGGYDITGALLGGISREELESAGFEQADIDEAAMAAIATSPRLIREILPEREWVSLEQEFNSLPKVKQEWYINERNAFAQYVPESPLTEETFGQLNPEKKQLVLEWYYTHRPEYFRERAKETGYVALAFVPIAGTVAYWGKMSSAMRALSVAGDILCFIPLLKGATAGARAARGYTAAARMKGAIKGVGQMALAELTAPADFLAHPVEITRGLGRQFKSALDTIFHPKKIPLGATELSYTTIRLPARDVGGADEAMKLRDAAVIATMQGKSTSATVGDITLDLNRSRLEKVGGPMAIHNTPDIRAYLNGAIVQGGKEGSGLFLSPNFHSRFAHATAFGDVPEGGVRGGLIIRDQRVLNVLKPSGKLYMGTAEIEAILKPGTVLPPPTQVLFTSDIAGNKLTFLVLGKKFTLAQVAKLKLLGNLDEVLEIFRPTMKLSNAQRTAVNLVDDMVELARERANIINRISVMRSAGNVVQVRSLQQQLTDVDGRIRAVVERMNNVRTTLRSSDVIWGQYTETGVLERWGELHPSQVQRTPLGRRLYGIEPARILRSTRVPEVARRLPVRDIVELGYRLPPIRKRTPTAYAPVYAPPYIPPQTPAYVPVDTPTYAPPYIPPYLPPYVPPYVPPYIPPYVPSKPPPTQRKASIGGDKRYKITAGSIAWRQGLFWKYIPPPWRQVKPITLKHPPKGAKGVGNKTPEQTIQMIGKSKAKVPRDASIDLGVVDIKISEYGKRIEFAGKGLETVAGHSIASTTKGMSIPATGAVESGYAKLAFGTALRSLVTEAYNGKIPKKFADRVMAQKLGKMSAKEIAVEIKQAKVSPSRRTEILKMLPDRVRRQVELWETMVNDYAPIRGLPSVKTVPPIFRRKKKTGIVKSASVG